MNNLYAVHISNNEGGTDFYAVAACSEQEALDIAKEQLGEDIAADAQLLSVTLEEQFNSFAMIGGAF